MRTIVITGASDGIGRSIALTLSEEKGNLILFGRDETKLATVKMACETNGAIVHTYAFDLNDSYKRAEAVKEALNLGPVDVLINNAGIWHKADDLTTLSEEKVQDVIATNLTSQILLTSQFLGQMRGREGTAILNIISKSGLVPQLGQTVYTASKYGMKGFTDVLRDDLKAEPIRVGAIYQSGTNTDMFTKAGEDFSTESFTEPDDLADVVAFMLSRPAKLWLNEVHVVY